MVASRQNIKNPGKIFRLLTSPFRIKPSFIIIGVNKCGTRAFLSAVTQHPLINAPTKKEAFLIHYLEVMPKLTGSPQAQVQTMVHILKSLKSVDSNKPILKLLISKLDIYIAKDYGCAYTKQAKYLRTNIRLLVRDIKGE